MSTTLVNLIRCGLLAMTIGAGAATAAPIAYLGLADGYWEVWTCEPDGSAHTRVTRFGADVSRVSWFPDGKRIFVNLHDGRWFELTTDGKRTTEIAPPMAGIADSVLSNDGKAVAFSLSTGSSIDDNDIWRYDLATRRMRKLTQMPRLQHEPAWSPDGSAVYFLSGDGDQAHDIWRVDAASGATEQLTVNDLYHFDLALRDDGAMLYSSNRTGDYEIWLRPSSGEPRQLTRAIGLDARPAWSPDGRQFVFESTRDGEVAIYRQTLDADTAVRLTPAHRAARAPAWRISSEATP